MKLTNRTYQVYATRGLETHYNRGTKEDMTDLFETFKQDRSFDCVILSKWSTGYNTFRQIDKAYPSSGRTYILYYFNTLGEEVQKSFAHIDEATSFTRILDKRIEKGTCLGYTLSSMSTI